MGQARVDALSPDEVQMTGHVVDVGDEKPAQSWWEWSGQPLDQGKAEKAAHEIAMYMTTPSIDHPVSWGRAFAAGSLEGLGTLASGLTTPRNIALTLATMNPDSAVAAKLPATLRYLMKLPSVRALQRTVGVVTGAQTGAAGVRTAMDESLQPEQRVLGGIQAATGVLAGGV